MAATSPTPLTAPQLPFSPGRPPPRPISKELHFNRDLSATRKLQAGVDLVANLVGVTLGPKGRNVVLGSKYGPPRIVNDGETVLKEVPQRLNPVSVALTLGFSSCDLGSTVIRDDMGLTLEKVGKEVLGSAVKVIIGKDSTLIVTDGSTQRAVEKQVAQIRSLEQYSEEKFQKKILNERIARLCGGIAIIQVGAQTVVELKDKKLRIEDSLNATKAAIEEGVVVGGGCTLLRLSTMVDGIKDSLDNEEQKIGADIFKRALSYPAKLIAKNAGVNGDVIVNKVLSNDDIRYGYNAAMNCYEDLVAAGILDPSKVVRCCLEHAAATAKTFLTSDLVVVDVKGTETISMRMPPRRPMPMSNMMRTPDSDPICFDRDRELGGSEARQNPSNQPAQVDRPSIITHRFEAGVAESILRRHMDGGDGGSFDGIHGATTGIELELTYL
ncbi:ruBisCO large subunit-binding protein subunit beta [Musa troglodytarum]|uniref:RuBisCO large subunit-binding protein subunit beta n=1 Tax=Musa troglodytarum TaxID=320322 RepID=A0A9E7I1U9_9LILI|nr:ruBisCO large subunit-binding protein subunit beta [Musa troglodytarum]